MKIEDIRNYVDISNWENFSECCVFEIEHNQTNYDNLTSLKKKGWKINPINVWVYWFYDN